jgi:hypothetical protein
MDACFPGKGNPAVSELNSSFSEIWDIIAENQHKWREGGREEEGKE